MAIDFENIHSRQGLCLHVIIKLRTYIAIIRIAILLTTYVCNNAADIAASPWKKLNSLIMHTSGILPAKLLDL